MAVAVVLLTALAGCSSGSTGTLHVQATDAPGAIDDFQSLLVTVDTIEIRDGNGTHSYEPANATFDLVKLTNGNLTTLFKDEVPAGTYSRMELVISGIEGTLTSGAEVEVKAPKGSIFLPIKFTVEAGQQTDFLFDIHVVKTGQGYNLQPNAAGSRTSK